MRAPSPFVLALLSVAAVASSGPACSSDPSTSETGELPEFTGAEVGPEGGEVTAPPGSGYEGVSLKIPAGALSMVMVGRRRR